MNDGIQTGFRFGLTLSLHSASGISLALIEWMYCNNPLPIMSPLVTSSNPYPLEGSSTVTCLALTLMDMEVVAMPVAWESQAGHPE